jgi:hypothetical protein
MVPRPQMNTNKQIWKMNLLHSLDVWNSSARMKFSLKKKKKKQKQESMLIQVISSLPVFYSS